MECIILAGGLGTRLSKHINGIPKCLAPINGRPFLDYLIQHLALNNCTKIIVSLGHKSEMVKAYLSQINTRIKIQIVTENQPLGTGGAIKFAMSFIEQKACVVCNGDTLFQIPLADFYNTVNDQDQPIRIALKYMKDSTRYGTVNLNGDSIIGFQEKIANSSGLINAGIYGIHQSLWDNYSGPEAFSFEECILQPLAQEGRILGETYQDYFIDIGVPEDFQRAQLEFKTIAHL